MEHWNDSTRLMVRTSYLFGQGKFLGMIDRSQHKNEVRCTVEIPIMPILAQRLTKHGVTIPFPTESQTS